MAFSFFFWRNSSCFVDSGSFRRFTELHKEGTMQGRLAKFKSGNILQVYFCNSLIAPMTSQDFCSLPYGF